MNSRVVIALGLQIKLSKPMKAVQFGSTGMVYFVSLFMILFVLLSQILRVEVFR
jgi:hypothetical protein